MLIPEKWVKVLTTTELYKAKVLEAMLKEQRIPCNLLNKQDSAYVMIGEIEVYVLEEDQGKVGEIIASLEEEE